MEGLFLVTALFIAYIVYVIANEKKGDTAAAKPAAAVAPTVQEVVAEVAVTAEATATAAVEEKSQVVEEKPQAIIEKAEPAARPTAKPVGAKVTVAGKPKAEPNAVKGSGLKDPVTGEVVTTYTNYRFTKRWIKEALVAEKLVDKIYKNDELNADAEAKIKAGLIKLEGMKKYKP